MSALKKHCASVANWTEDPQTAINYYTYGQIILFLFVFLTFFYDLYLYSLISSADTE